MVAGLGVIREVNVFKAESKQKGLGLDLDRACHGEEKYSRSVVVVSLPVLALR